MENPVDSFSEFMKERISQLEMSVSNCIGTALYIVGEIGSDEYLSRKEAKKLISNMKRDIGPKLGYLVLWGSGGVPFHAGIILMENPFYIVYRTKNNGFLTQSPLDDYSEYLFKNTGLKPSYRIPNKLLEIKK